MSIKAVAKAAGEAALSSFFDKLFDKLSFSDLFKIFQKENFYADLKKWERLLLKIQAVLDDAEEKQVTSKLVKIWLDELEDLAYDVDDILDEFATEALRLQLNPEPKSKKRKILGGNVGSNGDFAKLMRSKIEGINRRLQTIVEEKKNLELRENTGGRTITTTSRPPSTSLVNESRTYGRDEDKKEIVKLLLESSDAQLCVIPIVGMGGLGKTTLAQLVYDEVSRHFKLKAWVCVSEDFDNLRLTKEILHSFTSESCHDNNNLDSLQGKLKDTLSGKKFLLILDDVWNENYELWTELCKPFEFGAQGSKIVVTTRNDGVSSIMGTTPPYKLKELSRDACLRVFTHHALDATDFSEHPELEEFGQRIVDRCKGAPLAAKALGGLLRTKHDPYEWEDVLNSKIWDIPEDKSSIFSVLKLSYNYLPSHLKRCFAYCSLFPKDDTFEMKDLVLLWMAEGLVQETKGKKPMEDLGGDYFRDLLNRSFFQQSSFGESLFVMHDLINDLAIWAAGDLCCRLEDQSGGSKQSEISTKVRHFSYIVHSNDCIPKFDEDVHLRTFLSLPLYQPYYGLTNFDVKYCLFPQLRCLRVLSLSGNYIIELPSSIGDLKHLRYLNLSFTKITILPESTSSLCNLQTLILTGCKDLTKLPEKIENLVNLRHLNISNSNSIREMPAGIAKLKSLRTLCFENMDEWQNWIPCRVECEEFPCLRELSIINCPKLGKFSYHLPLLEKLLIFACEQLVVSISSHSVIQVLEIVGCKEVVHGFVKVEKLIIKNCEELTSLCEDGLMSFVTLEIKIKSCQSLANIKLKSTLRTLKIEECSALESLEFAMDEGGVSSTSSLLMNEENLSCIGNKKDALLEHLLIYSCEKLKSLPRGLHELCHLEEIDIYECNSLVSLGDSLPTNLRSLEIQYCEKLEALPNNIHNLIFLQDLLIGGCPSIVSFPEEGFPTNLRSLEIEYCEKLEALPNNIHNLIFLQDLSIPNCPSIVSFPEEGFPTNLRSLNIVDCEKLETLPNNMHNLNFLQDLLIGDCPSIVSFPEEGFPTNLRSLDIVDCEKLETLPNNMHNLNFLQDLLIGDCPSIVSFPEEGFPTNLRSLNIVDCEKLETLPNNMHNLHFLQDLSIYNCPSIVSFPEEGFPTNLRSLEIKDCKKLEALPNNMHNLNFLQDLSIPHCPSIVSFPEEGFPTNLRSLKIEYCEKLEALPNNMHNLNFLQGLSIRNCPSIISLPEDGFPTNLRGLSLSGANLCKQVFELGLHRLTSLTILNIVNGIMDSFPEEEDGKTMLMLMLPTSLTTLSLLDFPNLLFLSWKFFQNLSTLEQISINQCPKLESLSEKCFPSSLQRLYIYNCPVLKQNCEKDKGIMWSKIAKIPLVMFDNILQTYQGCDNKQRSW